MRLSQGLVQGLWDTDSELLQIPHFDKKIMSRIEEYNDSKEDEDEMIMTIPDILDMEDDTRNELLIMPPDKLLSVANFCNNFPDIEMTISGTSWENKTIVDGNSKCSLVLLLNRNSDDDDDDEDDQMEEIQNENSTSPGIVNAPFYPQEKKETWWIFVGDFSSNNLLAVKRVQYFKKRSKVSLSFEAPNENGSHTLSICLMSVCPYDRAYVGPT